MDDDRAQRIHRILSCSEALVHGFNPSRDRAWLRVDLTMPQLKALIYVTKNEGATSGQIASNLGVGLSTITGIVDRLAEQQLVTRREDPRDRRITRVLPTVAGAELVDELIEYRNEVVTAILSQLEPDQLRLVETAFQYLLGAVARLEAANGRSEVVA
ncbi:MAG: MarR family transcriptional regulator [Chloroflexi bacterium]|nr:MarR family transcriptional regulator [Chloroflexota bacterium]MBV9603274.1 MarR family transcriptional regulator [Chloroflexota bacterium]